MKQELPNLVDERRFRRREPDQVERDEFGRVRISYNTSVIKGTLTWIAAQMAGRADTHRPGAHPRLQLESTGGGSWRRLR